MPLCVLPPQMMLVPPPGERCAFLISDRLCSPFSNESDSSRRYFWYVIELVKRGLHALACSHRGTKLILSPLASKPPVATVTHCCPCRRHLAPPVAPALRSSLSTHVASVPSIGSSYRERCQALGMNGVEKHQHRQFDRAGLCANASSSQVLALRTPRWCKAFPMNRHHRRGSFVIKCNCPLRETRTPAAASEPAATQYFLAMFDASVG